MNKKVIFIIFMLLFVLTLTSCKNKEEKDLTIYEGMIVDKIFDSGYIYTQMVPSGKVMIPVVYTVPDRYYVVIYKNERIAKHQVTKSFYDTFEIGSFVTVGEENLDKEVINNE